MSTSQRVLAALSAAEGLIVAAVVGVGAALVWPESGLLAFGIAWYLPILIDRTRRRT